jgi:MHS family alpha-ketoglutarate permease-like MFS transporter
MKSYLAKLLVLIKGWDGSAFGAKGRVAMASEVSGAEVSFVTEGASSRKQRSVVLGATIGNFIEWYDWTIYGLFSGVFASQIFPSNDKTVSLLVVLSTFALGFLMRPVGAIVLSPIADRIGRRQMLSLTLLLMGAGSLAIALTPSFETIGFGAPVIVLLARLLQGFSAGGEYQGASVFLVEHAPATRRGFIGSMQNLSIGLAVLAANGVATLTTANLPNAELHDWGWRVPFFVGALMSLYGFYIRRSLPETPLFLETASHAGVEKRPLLRVIREFPREALYVFSVQITTVFFYLWTIYLPTYANLASNHPLKQ